MAFGSLRRRSCSRAVGDAGGRTQRHFRLSARALLHTQFVRDVKFSCRDAPREFLKIPTRMTNGAHARHFDWSQESGALPLEHHTLRHGEGVPGVAAPQKERRHAHDRGRRGLHATRPARRSSRARAAIWTAARSNNRTLVTVSLEGNSPLRAIARTVDSATPIRRAAADVVRNRSSISCGSTRSSVALTVGWSKSRSSEFTNFAVCELRPRPTSRDSPHSSASARARARRPSRRQ